MGQNTDNLQQKLKYALSTRKKSYITDANRVPSAVLLPIYYKQGEPYILFTKRTEKVAAHKGQVSFPGGAYEKEDKTLADTALRECAEEIGLSADAIELLGELDDDITSSSPYVISPFVALVHWPYPLKTDPAEVAEIIEVPISALLDKDCVQRQEIQAANGRMVTNYTFTYNGKIIWGTTARILNQLLGVYSQAINDHETSQN